MKIALRAPHNPFADTLMTRLQAELPNEELTFWDAGADTPPSSGIEVVLAYGGIHAAQMEALPKLALIQTIWVSYAPGAQTGNSDSVAEYAVMLVLAAARRLGIARQSIFDSKVQRPMLNESLPGKTVCIVGWGTIGERVGARLKPFGVTLLAVDKQIDHVPQDVKAFKTDDLKVAVAQADFLILCVRGSKENDHLINADVMAAMKQGAMLVNIARGTLVDGAALVEAVRSGHLAGAALDVVEHEPVKPDDPLMSVPEIFVTPHLAGFTTTMLEGTVKYVCTVLSEFKAGRKIESILNQPEQPRKPLQG